jgi:hypothetical protein
LLAALVNGIQILTGQERVVLAEPSSH